MDQKSIDAILKIICESDMDINQLEICPVSCSKNENGKKIYTVHISYSIPMFSQNTSLSDAWIAGNLLLFIVFDGYLESKYDLEEGASFKNHYNNLPENDEIEIIQKNCYRVFKIIRNSIQHNLSSVNIESGSYSIDYNYRNTEYKLQISRKAITNLYKIILNIMKDCIMGMEVPYRTYGHFIGIIRMLYSEMIEGIAQISDDIHSELISFSMGQQLRASVRYPVENPILIEEDEHAITFDHVENNGTLDVKSDQYRYSTDYI